MTGLGNEHFFSFYQIKWQFTKVMVHPNSKLILDIINGSVDNTGFIREQRKKVPEDLAHYIKGRADFVWKRTKNNLKWVLKKQCFYAHQSGFHQNIMYILIFRLSNVNCTENSEDNFPSNSQCGKMKNLLSFIHAHSEKISRQINYLVILVIKPLFSRNFCQKSVRAHCGKTRILLPRKYFFVKSI